MSARRFALASFYAVIMALALPAPAPAAVVRCKSDPTVLLSDGTILDLTADINAAPWDVSSVEYVIHVPAHTWAIAVLRTPNWPTTKEKFVIWADCPSGCFLTSTLVRTTYKTDVKAQLVVDTSISVESGASGRPIKVDTHL